LSIRVLLADDHKIMREGLRSLLTLQQGIKVIAEADNGHAAVRLCRELSPDVVMIDITMSDLNGIETTRRILLECPDAKVIALSMYSDRQFVEGMLRAGALGYLLKDCALHDVITAIRAVASKQIYLSPKIAGMVDERRLNHASKQIIKNSPLLTAKERVVLEFITEGLTRRQIAETLHLHPRTVERYDRSLRKKFNVENTAELISVVLQNGLISLES
jgi:two-component system, NarL family, response regulator NreC